MSNSEADVPQDTASDVIGNSRPNPGDGRENSADDVPSHSSTAQDSSLKNRPAIPKNDRTTKMTTYRPITRTSSAPPEEHVADAHKSHFQPTKTQQSFLSANDQGRRPPQYNSPGIRNVPPFSRANEDSTQNSSQASSVHGGEASAESSHANATAGDSVHSSGAPSPHSTIESGPAPGGPSSPSILAPLSPVNRSGSEQGSFQGNSGQNSPSYPGGNPGRGFRNNNGPMGPGGHNNDRSPYSQGQGGPGNYNNNREPYNNNSRGDYREGGGRTGGRTNRRAPQAGAYGGRGPHMHDGGGGGGMGMGMNSPPQMGRGNFVGHSPLQQSPLQQQQVPPQPQQQWMQVIDPYTGQPHLVQSGPVGPAASPYQQQQSTNPSYPAGAPIPPGGRPQQSGGMQMQAMNTRGGPMPHQGMSPQQQQQQQQYFVQQQQQQQMAPQPQLIPQNMMMQQHLAMHNQAQQQYIQPVFNVPYGMELSPQDQQLMMEMQQMQQLQQMQQQQVQIQTIRQPNGQYVQVQVPIQPGYQVNMVQPQQMAGFAAQHMQHVPGHPGQQQPPQQQQQQMFIPQEMMGYAPQMVQMPMHMAQQGVVPSVPHMQPNGMQPGVNNFSNYPPAVTGLPHVPPNAQHYNPNMPPQYGPQMGNRPPPHSGGPHDSPGPSHGQRMHHQKSPIPSRDHHTGPPHHSSATAPYSSSVPHGGSHHTSNGPSNATSRTHTPTSTSAGTPTAAGTAAALAAAAAAAATPAVSSAPPAPSTTTTALTSDHAAAAPFVPAAVVAAATSSEAQPPAQADNSVQENEKEGDKETPAVVNPYQDHSASAVVLTQTQSSPTPVKERKVLSYKKKDGSALDIHSFQKKEEAAVASAEDKPVSSSAVEPKSVAEAAVAPVSVPVPTPVPVFTPAPVAETVVAPVPVAAALAPTPPVSGPSSRAATPVVADSTSARVSPKTVPSPETVPAVMPKRSEAHAVPTVEQQLKDLRIEGPSPDENESGVAAAMSPAIKSADLPVFIGTSTASSTAATGAPSVSSTSSTFEPSLSKTPSPQTLPEVPVFISAPETVASGNLTPGSSRSKKTSKKELLAKADAAAATSELSAYESSAAAAVKAPTVPEIKVVTPRVEVPVKAAATAALAEDSLPDSWDDGAELNLSPLITPTEPAAGVKENSGGRSLRPGGNKSFNINLHQAIATIRFSKAEIMSFRPADKSVNNPLTLYGNITFGDASSGGASQKGSGQSGGGGGWNNSNKGPRSDARNPEGEGWKRGDNMPPAPSSASKHKKSNSNVPMPKKIISDPMVSLATETMAILNKITPQTFEKLSQLMLGLNVQNIAQMSKVIELIFEKAVQEQGFANLYAELCFFLNSKATHWAFYEVFRVVSGVNEFQNEFFWVRECSFPPIYAGPYISVQECLKVLHSAELPPMQPLTSSQESVGELWLLTQPDLLVKVSRNEKVQGYYVTYMPFSEYSEEMRSQNTFGDVKLAIKDAKNKHFFRAKLVNNCQTEFQQSTMNESVYGELEEEKRQLLANKATLSEADFFYKSADIDDRRLKLKRRMLGNIRFVGELFKQKMLTDVTIQDCISDLMGTPDAWKSMQDEQDIECLCHLLRTAGERLELRFSSSQEALRNFNLHFDRLRVLARDKSLNSRMRFAIEEVLMLRENGWQKRGGVLEGPVKISEIHRKMQEEAVGAPHHQSSPMVGGNSRGGPKGGPHGQQQQQQQRVQILSRPGQGGRGSGGQQDVRKASAASEDSSKEKFGRTVSSSVYETGGHRAEHSERVPPTGRVHGGEALRRVQSEYSPPVSGSATPTNSHNNGRHVRTSSTSSAVAEVAPSTPVETDFTDPKMLNRAKSAISEYLEQKDLNEVKLFLSEGPAGMYGYFVLQLLDKYLNATKEPVLGALLDLVREKSLGEVLAGVQQEIFQALRACETLKCMPDTTMDIKEAPERFASVIGALMQFGALNEPDVQTIMSEAKLNCLEELGNSESEWAAVYSRFAKQLSLTLAA